MTYATSSNRGETVRRTDPPSPAVIGVGLIVSAVVTVAVAADLVATRTGRPTISRWLGRAALHPLHGPLVAAAMAAPVVAFGWHMAQIIADEWWNH